MIQDLAQTIIWAYPQAQFTIVDNSYNKLKWLSDDIPKPTLIELKEIETNRLIEINRPVSPITTTNLNWQGLLTDLRGTSIFGKAMTTSNTNAFTLLMATLTSPYPDLNDFIYAFNLVKAGVTGDYELTAEENEQLNLALTNNNFPII